MRICLPCKNASPSLILISLLETTVAIIAVPFLNTRSSKPAKPTLKLQTSTELMCSVSPFPVIKWTIYSTPMYSRVILFLFPLNIFFTILTSTSIALIRSKPLTRHWSSCAQPNFFLGINSHHYPQYPRTYSQKGYNCPVFQFSLSQTDKMINTCVTFTNHQISNS